MRNDKRVFRIRENSHQVATNSLTAIASTEPRGSLVREEVARTLKESPTSRARTACQMKNMDTLLNCALAIGDFL